MPWTTLLPLLPAELNSALARTCLADAYDLPRQSDDAKDGHAPSR